MSEKTKKILIRIGIILSAIVFVFVVLNIIPPKKNVSNNPFFTNGERTMVAAHRGGGDLNPENTLKAHKYSREIGSDVLEMDLWTSKDGHLIVNHDGDLDRTSDAAIVYGKTDTTINDYTLEELENLNFGYHFKGSDKNNPYPYRNLEGLDGASRREVIKENEIGVLPVMDLLTHFYEKDKDLLFIIEFKEKGALGKAAADKLITAVKERFPAYLRRIAFSSYHSEVEKHIEKTYPDVIRGACEKSATSFIVTQLLKVNIFDSTSFGCLQVPMKQSGITISKKTFIRRAHRRNIAVQFWTINDAEDMKELIELGADCIMTDNPLLLVNTIKSM